MKWLAALALAGCLAVTAAAMLGAATMPKDDALIMADWYEAHQAGADPNFVYECGRATKFYADLLGMSRDEVQIMLCMWHRESNYSMDAKGGPHDPDSFGLAQTRKRYFRKLRKFWRDRRVELGAPGALNTQMAFGVAEFYGKIQESHRAQTDIWDAVRRYNGSGHGAIHYARRVFVTYCNVFNHPPKENAPWTRQSF